ncbi:MAG TPA: protein kinase [Candidatus Paceibacterota bacterium]|nr:protein kinase [Candidatus Paceibacterota bacterium]
MQACLTPDDEELSSDATLDRDWLAKFHIQPPLEGNETPRGFGDYEFLGEIGRGGMGVIFKARQRRLNRNVAVKVILAGPLASADFVQRFQIEAQTAACLNHPHIVPIYEVGQHQGQHFYSMRLVEGPNLAHMLKQKGSLPQKEAARLVATVARAVHYAHQRGVLHRDLKPANILLDAEGQPHVTDFGLAKLLFDPRGLTLTHATLGTPNYMAPEQAAGHTRDATLSADIYSLGAILWEVLTGEKLFDAPTTAATIHQVLEKEPPRPSMRNPDVPRDLDTICLKCLNKDPQKRYASALELAEELKRWLRDEPIRARRASVVERSWRWCRRKPALASLTGALVLILVAGSLTAAWRIRMVRQQENYYTSIALADKYIRDGIIDQALTQLVQCPSRFRHWEWGWLLNQCHQEILSLSAYSNRPSTYQPLSAFLGLAFSPDNTRLVTHGTDGRFQVWDPADGHLVWVFGDATNPVTSWAFSPDGQQLALGMTNGVLRLRDMPALARQPVTNQPASSRQQSVFATGAKPFRGEAFKEMAAPVIHLAYSADGQRLAAATGDRGVEVWETSSGHELFGLTNLSEEIQALQFTPDGQQLILKSQDVIRFWDIEKRAELPPFQKGLPEYRALFIDPSGQHLATIDSRNQVALWSGGRQTHELGAVKAAQPVIYRRVFFSPDGRFLCTAGEQGTARVYQADTGEELFALPQRIQQAVFSPDSRRLVALSSERIATVWDLAKREESHTLRGHLVMIERAAFSPDGRRIATASPDGWVKIWSATAGREVLWVGSCVWGPAFSPDGRYVSLAGFGYPLKIWDTTNGQEVLTFSSRLHAALMAVFSADGQRVISVGNEKFSRVWDAKTGTLVRTLRGPTNALFSVAVSPDDRWIAAGDLGGNITIWEANSVQAHTIVAHTNRSPYGVVELHFDRTSSRLVSGAVSEAPKVWEVKTGKCLLTLKEASLGVGSALFSTDGRQIIASCIDKKLRIWDATSGRLRHCWPVRAQAGVPMGISPDGRRLAVPISDYAGFGYDEGVTEIWDLKDGRPLLELRGHRESLNAANFSPDGRRLLTVSFDFKARIWETFPWLETDYPGSRKLDFKERVRGYATNYWRQRLNAEALRVQPVVSKDADAAFWPPRDPQTDPKLIDLTPHYTGVLQTIFFQQDYPDFDDDLRALPVGVHRFGGTPFDVRGVVLLRKLESRDGFFQTAMWDRYPREITSIRIRCGFSRLHVLHGACRWASLQDGTPIGSYIWHYVDGSTNEVKVVYGRDVREWWRGGKSPCHQGDPQDEMKRLPEDSVNPGKVVWVGANPVTEKYGATLRLYQSTYENPHPDLEVNSIDFVSAMSSAAPFLIAMTVE